MQIADLNAKPKDSEGDDKAIARGSDARCVVRFFAWLRGAIRVLWLNLVVSRGVIVLMTGCSRFKFHRRASACLSDLVIVFPPRNGAHWILDGICKEIRDRIGFAKVRCISVGEPLPDARFYFFSHYVFFAKYLRPMSPVFVRPSLVFATHLEPSKHRVDDALVARILDLSANVICMNAALRERLERLGVRRDNLSVVIGGADPEVFVPHVRTSSGKVGFCSSYYQRKSPETVLAIVRSMPHREFLLLGKNWRNCELFEQLNALPNFEYVETEYVHYPAHYSRMSIFVSVSLLEGGPIPLLESMMCNVVPVASRTGFAPDVIEHGQNGFLFDVGSGPGVICALIERAYELDTDVAETVRGHFGWTQFVSQIRERMVSDNAF
jgi:glycosyltransferase involved in cell wall biosynthesis